MVGGRGGGSGGGSSGGSRGCLREKRTRLLAKGGDRSMPLSSRSKGFFAMRESNRALSTRSFSVVDFPTGSASTCAASAGGCSI